MAAIALSKGRVAQVDDSDYAVISGRRWHFNGRYASRSDGHTTIYMHREILGLSPGDGQEVDHINGDPLDNRRVNLRVTSHAVNGQNRQSLPGHSTYRGVSWMKSGNRARRWVAQAMLDGKYQALGYFAEEIDAAAAAAQWRVANMPGAIEDPQLLARTIPPVPLHAGVRRHREKAMEVERRWAEGQSLNEIAEAFGCTRNAIGSYMARIRKQGYDLPYRRTDL